MTNSTHIALKFSNLQSLWEFKKLVSAYEVTIDAHEGVMICSCTQEEVAIALTKFGARITGEEETKDRRN